VNDDSLARARVAIVYDCLFPYTVGGGERWYRYLAEGLRDANADVTYLTRRQWDEQPLIPGIRVVAVSSRSELYDSRGARKLGPTLRFGAGLFRWLVGHRREFDIVEVANFPFWSVLAVRAALAGTGIQVVVDWFEIWSLRFWNAYAGRVTGTIGYAVQHCCLAVSPTIVVLSASNARRLRALGRIGTPLVLAGLLPSEVASSDESDALVVGEPPYVLFAGRHIFDKGVDLLPRAFAAAHRIRPDLRFVIAGDGPLRNNVAEECDQLGIGPAVSILGFVSDEELEYLVSRASCVVVPSRREGYGFMPVDAMGKGTPVVTAGFDENLAVDHIESGRNGFVATPPGPDELAGAIVRVLSGGATLRKTTLEWYTEHAPTKSVDCSVRQIIECYARWLNPRTTIRATSGAARP
jgi:glycosyltransferase involved in cell wall biosynthesis